MTLPHLRSIIRITTGFGRDGHAEIVVVYQDRDLSGAAHERSYTIPIPVDGMTGTEIDEAMSRIRSAQ